MYNNKHCLKHNNKCVCCNALLIKLYKKHYVELSKLVKENIKTNNRHSKILGEDNTAINNNTESIKDLLEMHLDLVELVENLSESLITQYKLLLAISQKDLT